MGTGRTRTLQVQPEKNAGHIGMFEFAKAVSVVEPLPQKSCTLRGDKRTQRHTVQSFVRIEGQKIGSLSAAPFNQYVPYGLANHLHIHLTVVIATGPPAGQALGVSQRLSPADSVSIARPEIPARAGLTGLIG